MGSTGPGGLDGGGGIGRWGDGIGVEVGERGGDVPKKTRYTGSEVGTQEYVEEKLTSFVEKSQYLSVKIR